MTRDKPVNIVASVRQRLLNLSKERGEDFQLVLTYYAVERLLYRLVKAGYGEHFILKGAMLFAVWTGRLHRPTRDLDLLGRGYLSNDKLAEMFGGVCHCEVAPDGLTFHPETIKVIELREDEEYQGRRVNMVATLGKARIPVQVDIGFGDAITPKAETIEYPGLLDLPTPRIYAYPPETVVAEKSQAMVALGMPNSRMKDFYDLWVMARLFEFDGATLAKAIQATFRRRETPIPSVAPIALTEEFSVDRDKVTQWKAFLRRNHLEGTLLNLTRVAEMLRAFLVQAFEAAANRRAFDRSWAKGGPWT